MNQFKMEKIFDEIREKFKSKEDEVKSISKILGDKEFELKELRRDYSILKGRYSELNDKWNKLSESFKKVEKCSMH